MRANFSFPVCLFFCYFYQIYCSDVVEDCPEEISLHSSQLLHFAKEAQLTGNYQLAAQYYEEVQKKTNLE